MAKIGRPKSENVKKKVLSIRVEDSMYKCICDYARKHKMTSMEIIIGKDMLNNSFPMGIVPILFSAAGADLVS